MKLPFAAYDFFGYLSAGFVIVAAAEFASDSNWLLTQKAIPIPLAVFWIVLAYIIGHIVANVSSYLLEHIVVRKILKSPEETLFNGTQSKLKYVFPVFFQSLPITTQDRLKERAKSRHFPFSASRAFFLHCHSIAKRSKATSVRLSTFLNQYGFCRNMCMAGLISAVILIWGSQHRANPYTWSFADLDTTTWGGTNTSKLAWAVLACLLSIGMFYRYLKFFRHYTMEVFHSYAESSHKQR